MGNIVGITRWVGRVHLDCYLAEFHYRFSLRFYMESMLSRLLTVATRTPAMPQPLLKMAWPGRLTVASPAVPAWYLDLFKKNRPPLTGGFATVIYPHPKHSQIALRKRGSRCATPIVPTTGPRPLSP